MTAMTLPRPAAPAPTAAQEPPVAGAMDVAGVFDAHALWMHRVAQRLSGSAVLADDVVQEVFVLLHRRRETVDDRTGIRTWLYRAILNVTRQRRRSDRRYETAMAGLAHQPSVGGRGPEAQLASREHGALVRACIATLSEAQRETFVLFELEGIGGAEIAAILDVPVNTVWTRLRLARIAFREAWDRANGGER